MLTLLLIQTGWRTTSPQPTSREAEVHAAVQRWMVAPAVERDLIPTAYAVFSLARFSDLLMHLEAQGHQIGRQSDIASGEGAGHERTEPPRKGI